MPPSPPATHQHLAFEAELVDGPRRFARERLRLPLGQEATFGWLRHPPSVLVVPRLEDGRLLLARRWRPAVGRWVLEFPTGLLEPGESAAAGAARLIGGLIGGGEGCWQSLGVLRPNPGYSDEQMVLGWMALGPKAGAELVSSLNGATFQPLLCTPQTLETRFLALEEPVDGRSVSAWFLAQRRGIV